MTAPYGRGRPPTFTAERQAEFLELLAAGARVGEAAQKVGVERHTPAALARRDPTFADRYDRAMHAGRRRVIPHGTAAGHDVHGCRCTPCKAAAQQQQEQADEDTRAPVILRALHREQGQQAVQSAAA